MIMQKTKAARKPFFQNDGVLSFLASLLCIVVGLLIGYIVLLIINPAGANDAIIAILKNFFVSARENIRLKNLGNTLVRTAPLIMCSLSVLFAYKVGLFNIGAAGQYTVGAGACLLLALRYNMPWYVCLIGALLMGALLGALSGVLKAFCNVNEVISCIMLNWIGLYTVNEVLNSVKDVASPYTLKLADVNPGALIPTLGMGAVFGKNKYVGIALPLTILIAVFIWILLERKKLGYELKATGYNRNAAKYCGMQERRNIVLTMAIAGALAGIGAGFLYLSGIEEWSCTQSSVPAMGFNGISAAFLGGLNPFGVIFSSYFIQHITAGGSNVDLSMYSAQISDLISSIIIYLCSFVMLFKFIMKSGHTRRMERKANKAEVKS